MLYPIELRAHESYFKHFAQGLVKETRTKPVRLEAGLNVIYNLPNRTSIGGYDVIRGRLVFGRPLGQDFLNFFNEGLGSRQRRPLGVSADAHRNRLYRSGQPEQRPGLFETLHILRSKNRAAACINYQSFPRSEFLTHRRFEVTEIFPAMLRNNLRNRLSGTPHNLGIGGYQRPTEPPGQNFTDCAFPGSAIADQDDVHWKRDSKTARITSAGAG